MRARTLLRSVAGILLAAALAAPTQTTVAAPADDPARHVPLRAVTYNMHAGIGDDGRLDLARTAATLRALHADVIGLQEVDVHWGARSGWRDQARALAEALDMRVFFAPIYSLEPPGEGAPRREYGLAVLTRLPVLHAHNHEITRLSTQSGDPAPAPAPGFPEVVVSARGALVHVYVTHLDYRSDPSVREMQVEDMLRIMSADGPGAQQVLVGDLNAPPQAPELSRLWEPLVDVWSAVGAGDGPTFPATEPVKRIDYVTVSRQVTPTAVRVVPSDASDHLPVVADLLVRRGG